MYKQKNFKLGHFSGNCGVDAGMIAVIPQQEIDKHCTREKGYNDHVINEITLGKGRYEVFGVIDAYLTQYFGGIIELNKKQKVYICDPCYLFMHDDKSSKAWDKFLHTVYPEFDKGDCEVKGQSDDMNFIIVDHFGGDGLHSVELFIRKIAR